MLLVANTGGNIRAQLLCAPVDQAGSNRPFGACQPAALIQQARLGDVKKFRVMVHAEVEEWQAQWVFAGVLAVRSSQPFPVSATLRLNAVAKQLTLKLEFYQSLRLQASICFIAVGLNPLPVAMHLANRVRDTVFSHVKNAAQKSTRQADKA